MAVNPLNARIFGGDDDRVSIGRALGVDLPTDLSPLAEEDFTDLGWLHSDGATAGGDMNVAKFRGHQGGRVIRQKVTESSKTFQFQCLETTATTVGLQHNIKEGATVEGVTNMRVSTGSVVVARPFVLDFFDVDGRDEVIQERYVIPRGEIGQRSEFKLANSDIRGFTFTVEIIEEFFIITNDPGQVIEPEEPVTP